jgi:hypothetical protein
MAKDLSFLLDHVLQKLTLFLKFDLCFKIAKAHKWGTFPKYGVEFHDHILGLLYRRRV